MGAGRLGVGGRGDGVKVRCEGGEKLSGRLSQIGNTWACDERKWADVRAMGWQTWQM